MNKTKSLYEAPNTKTLVVRFGGMLMQSQFSSKGTEFMTTDEAEDF